MALAKTDKMNSGSVDEACATATFRSEVEIVALRATVCINQPRLET